MIKKQLTIRLSDESLQFVEQCAVKNNLHHPVSPDVPNISKTIDFIIKKQIVKRVTYYYLVHFLSIGFGRNLANSQEPKRGLKYYN
jgi:hypothetical protein